MSGKTKTKTEVTPWKPAEGYIKDAMGQQQAAYGQSQSIINQNMPGLNAAIAKINANIEAPPAYAGAARDQLTKTINGDYLDPASNPYASGMADLIAQKAQAQYNSTFGARGRSTGGLAALLSQQGVGDALNSFYGNIYEGERGRQQQAVMAAPAFRQDEYTDINALLPAVSGAANLPMGAANAYGAGITNTSSPYSNTNTTQKKVMGLADYIGMGLQLGSAFLPGAGGLLGAAGGAGGAGSIVTGGALGAGPNPFARILG